MHWCGSRSNTDQKSILITKRNIIGHCKMSTVNWIVQNGLIRWFNYYNLGLYAVWYCNFEKRHHSLNTTFIFSWFWKRKSKIILIWFRRHLSSSINWSIKFDHIQNVGFLKKFRGKNISTASVYHLHCAQKFEKKYLKNEDQFLWLNWISQLKITWVSVKFAIGRRIQLKLSQINGNLIGQKNNWF